MPPDPIRGQCLLALLLVVGASAGIAHAEVIQSTLDETPPVQGVAYFNQLTGNFTGPRLFRDGIPSSCSAAKPAPGSFGTGPYRYDAYSFVATETTCLTFRLRRIGAGGSIHLSLHSSIDPADGSVGWLADSGSGVSSADATVGFSASVVQGQTYVLLIFHATSNTAGGEYEVSFEEPFTGVTESVLDLAAPVPSVQYVEQQTGLFATERPLRDGDESVCGAPGTAPGVIASTGPFRYDQYRFLSPVSGCVTVTLQRTSTAGNLFVVAYSDFVPTDLSTGWVADSGQSTGTENLRAFSMDVIAGQAFTLVVSSVVASEVGAEYSLSVALPMQPPTLLRAETVAGNAVRFRWKPPLNGPVADTYVVEGGVNPGEVLASIPVGGSSPILDLAVPTGAFYVRARAWNGGVSSPASNEIRIFVNTAVPPSAPTALLGVVNGSSLALSWRNRFEGGAPAFSMLDVTGSAVVSIRLGAGGAATFAGVPGGSYTLRLRSGNGAGVSLPSDPISVTLPGACSGIPQPPPGFLVYKIGNRITAVWDVPVAGQAPTSYVLEVTGALTLSIPTPARTLSGVVSPGTYHLAVRSMNACGSSVATPVQAVTIP